MKLIKKRDLTATEAANVTIGVLGSAVDRRAFLRRAGLGLGGTAVAATLPTTMIRRAEAAPGVDPGAAGPGRPPRRGRRSAWSRDSP